MKKYLIGAAAGVFFMLIAGHFYTSCRIGAWKRDAIKWQAEYEASKSQVLENEIESNNRIGELEEKIGTLNGNIDSLMFVNANLEVKVKQKEYANSQLSEEAERLKGEVQPVLDANPKVAALVSNLEEQIVNKDGIIFTLREQRKNDQQIIFSLTAKYEAQVEISKEYEGRIVELKGLLNTVELRLSLVDKRIASLHKTATWKTVGLVGFGILALAAIL